jgi:hypothetical protein
VQSASSKSFGVYNQHLVWFEAGHFAQPAKSFRGTNMHTNVMLMLDYCAAMQHMFLLHIPNKNVLKQ